MTLTSSQRSIIDHAPRSHQAMWAARLAWHEQRHKGQRAPKGSWRGWIIRAGRGYGKTLTGSFDAIEHCLDNPGWRYGVVAPTLGDARDTCIEGETGIINVLTAGTETFNGMGLVEDSDFVYNRSRMEVSFPNGSHIKAFGTEKPDRLRGPQHHRVWFEEVAAFKDANKGNALQTAFNNARIGCRLGEHAQWIATSTPRYNQLILDIEEDPKVVTTRGTTYDNLANLAANYQDEILAYEGTALEAQELLGEILEITGAIFKAEWFRYFERDGDLFHLWDGRTVAFHEMSRYITCDPAISTKETADWTVFVVWGVLDDGTRLVLDLVRARLEAPDIIDTAAALLSRHSASWVGFESVAFQTALIQFARRDGLPAQPLIADRDKVTRAQPLVFQLKASQIGFPADAPFLEEMERELLFFPDGPHDDQVDALAYGAASERKRRKLTAR